jgi:hypothetical protein
MIGNRLFQRVNIITLLCALVVSVQGPTVMAASILSDETSRIGNGIFYYNPLDTCASTPEVITPIEEGTGENLEAILRFFVGKGLTLAAAAGFAGNMKQESGLNPKIIQGGAIAPDNYTPVSGVGFGLVQWTSGGRQQGLVAFAKERSMAITDLTLQLEYTWHELNTGYKTSTLNKVATMTDPVEAAIIIHDNYEISADTDAEVRAVRGGNAKSYYNQFKDTITDGGGVTTTPTSSDSATSSCGVEATSTEGDVGAANGFTFPLKTTKDTINKGIEGAIWRPQECSLGAGQGTPGNCHHDYNAADIFAPTGTPIIAAKGGKVVSKTTGSCTYSGCNVSVKADDGLLYYYTHMSKHATVNVGQKVQAAQQLGTVGTDGTAMNTPRHLHIDITRGAYRPSCSGSSCNDDDFIHIQPILIPAFNNLPGGATADV